MDKEEKSFLLGVGWFAIAIFLSLGVLGGLAGPRSAGNIVGLGFWSVLLFVWIREGLRSVKKKSS